MAIYRLGTYLHLMMMRQIVMYLLAALTCVVFVPISNASGVAGIIEFQNLISQNEDIRIMPDDLAYFLVIHNYDATPENGYVQVRIDDKIYKVVPNGVEPGLADLSVIN
jgi:hypothetical protein